MDETESLSACKLGLVMLVIILTLGIGVLLWHTRLREIITWLARAVVKMGEHIIALFES